MNTNDALQEFMKVSNFIIESRQRRRERIANDQKKSQADLDEIKKLSHDKKPNE